MEAIRSDHYVLLPADLRDVKSLGKQLIDAGLDPKLVSIRVKMSLKFSECSVPKCIYIHSFYRDTVLNPLGVPVLSFPLILFF